MKKKGPKLAFRPFTIPKRLYQRSNLLISGHGDDSHHDIRHDNSHRDNTRHGNSNDRSMAGNMDRDSHTQTSPLADNKPDRRGKQARKPAAHKPVPVPALAQ